MVVHKIEMTLNVVSGQKKLLEQLNPERVLERGYALVRGDLAVGNEISITMAQKEVTAKITNIKERANG